MIFSILSVIIGLYALINYKKALILYTIFQIFSMSTTLISIGGINLNSNLVLAYWYFFLYFIKNKKYKKAKEKFPFLFPFVLVSISLILSCFTAISGFLPEFTRIIMRIGSQYIYIYILWNVIETKDDFRYIFKYVTYIFFFASIYGIVEYFLNSNVLLDYKVILSSNTINLYDSSGLRGYRLTSCFEHPLGAGMMFGLYSSFYFALLVRNNKTVVRNKVGLITALLCLPCVILTKMRTAIIFTCIMFILVILNKKLTVKIFKKILITILVFTPILLYVLFQNSELITNLFSSSTSSEIGGSSLMMRLDQFDAIRIIIRQSPLFGLGETFRDVMTVNELTIAAKGYEGILFEQMSMHGYFGVFVALVLMYYSIIKIPKKYQSKEVAVVGIAYWLAYLVSSIPSFRLPFLYLVMFYFIKTSNRYKSKKGSKVASSNATLI
ncbi:O-antigen ligase family protein [Clostridium sp. 3-3]|uniref:O-antigen ligase family protein n=1 Tax=Clostridium sp. 3-3 TaxID=2070757 RepID=UPI000CDB7B91|nr:O-antigen ligase family protein [Clostridium sp. 3-3]POO85655.1 hypothetical protein C1H59_14885 [Clostridium sp. 3-3]